MIRSMATLNLDAFYEESDLSTPPPAPPPTPTTSPPTPPTPPTTPTTPNLTSNTRKPILVGICGGSCSGKTTVAYKIYEMLCPHSQVAIVSQDNFYRCLPPDVNPH